MTKTKPRRTGRHHARPVHRHLRNALGLQQIDLSHRLHAGRRDLPPRPQQHRRRLLLSGVDLAAGHPDGTEETSGGEAHHVHPAESPIQGRIGQHAGVPDGGPAAREGGPFDAGEAPEARADGPVRIHGESREADGVRHQCEEQVLGKTGQKHTQKEIFRSILTQEVVTGKRESLSPAPAKGPHVSART